MTVNNMKIKKQLQQLVWSIIALNANYVWAIDDKNSHSSSEKIIESRLHQARPDIQFTNIKPAPIPGLYQAEIANGPTLYVTPEGDKFIAGELFNIETSGFVKWEDPALVAERKTLLADINPKDSIIFKPKGKTKAVVYVFTDADCGYCRKLHNQLTSYNDDEGKQKPGYLDLGIEIRYLAYPRAGVPSESADKLITAWCAKDKQKTLTQLKQDIPVSNKTCTNPIAAEYALGGKVGVHGTPALWFPDGTIQPGYLPPEDMAKALGIL